MSVELPEAKILAEQMNQKLRGKQVKSFQAKDVQVFFHHADFL